LREFEHRKSEPAGHYKDPFLSSARPWDPKQSNQIMKKIDRKYGDHVAEASPDPKSEVLAAARRPSALSPEEEHPSHQVFIFIFIYFFLI
jgi:hypothetical protein